jgi:hypothetical protein
VVVFTMVAQGLTFSRFLRTVYRVNKAVYKVVE